MIRRLVLSLLLVGTVAPAAHGALISGAITTPADGTRVTTDASTDAPATTVTFSGTVTTTLGTVPELVCYFRNQAGNFTGLSLTGTVIFDGGGAWHAQVTPPDGANRCLMRLRDPAVALSLGPAAGQTGPTVDFGGFRLIKFASGPNAGLPLLWGAGSGQSAAIAAHDSPSVGGGPAIALVTGPELRRSRRLWNGAGLIRGHAALPITSDGGTIVDGLHSYGVDAARGVPLADGVTFGGALPGLAGIVATPKVDPATGAIGSDLAVPIVRCNGGADQPSPTPACTVWVRTGVVLHRSIQPNADGTSVRVSDRWVSDDGAAHTVRVQSREPIPFTPNLVGFRFPWVDGAAFKTHGAGDVVPLPPGQWRVDVAGDSTAPDGDLQFPRGALVTDRTPSAIQFADTAQFARIYDLAVPAGGDVRMETGYVVASTQAGVDSAATAMADAIAPPKVSITSPANGSTVTTTPVTVTGVVSDTVGVTSVTVNGAAVTPGADGVFTRSLVLTGPSTITVVAKDAAGNSAQAQVSVGFSPVEFTGTDGPDVLVGNALANVLSGLGGNDRLLCGVGGRDRVDGGAGDDTIDCVEAMRVAKGGADTIACGAGRDTVRADPFDVLSGCEVVTRVWIGSASRDVFRGTRANDRFEAKAGNDAVTCGGGKDVVLAGAGKDTVNCRDLVPRRANADLVVCGTGVDSVIVDKFDTVRGCEKVTRR